MNSLFLALVLMPMSLSALGQASSPYQDPNLPPEQRQRMRGSVGKQRLGNDDARAFPPRQDDTGAGAAQGQNQNQNQNQNRAALAPPPGLPCRSWSRRPG